MACWADFDGAWAGYSLNPTWRVNGVVGIAGKFSTVRADRKTFAGLSVDLTRLPEQWSGSGYFIEQRAGTVVERQAFGMEAHYFDTNRNYMGLLDYDRMFKAVNIAMFQGNWTNQAGDNYTLLADHRKSPSLQLSNAFGSAYTIHNWRIDTVGSDDGKPDCGRQGIDPDIQPVDGRNDAPLLFALAAGRGFSYQ